MDFDPLSLYSAEVKVPREESGTYVIPHLSRTSQQSVKPEQNEEDSSMIEPLHILDLPILRLKPPYEVLFTILKLLTAEELTNFDRGNVMIIQEEVKSQEVYESKGIPSDIAEKAVEWTQKHCPRLDSETKLACLPQLASSLRLRHEVEYNAYLTRIVSSNLEWIDENCRDQVHKECSLRISENCGRAAQPDTVRRMNFPELAVLSIKEDILLNEPSLTSDNLGLKTWGSSYLLAKRLISKGKEYLKGPVLELGSGTGLVGIVSSLLGYDTTLTDLKEILPNLKKNVELNSVIAPVEELDWSDPQKYANESLTRRFKTIVISDPIYSSHHPQMVVNTINTFLEDSGQSRVVLQIPIRPRFEKERANLWSLMNGTLEEIESEVLQGFDDFGEMEFYFKFFRRKKASNNL